MLLQLRILVLGYFLFFSSTQAQSLGMNDVSVLLPLPTLREWNELLRPMDRGAKGELLPLDVFRYMPVLTNQADQDSLYLNNLKVIGIRFDPCFSESPQASPCRKQVRLVWQPTFILGDQTSTIDAAIHTFYEFQDAEWNLLMTELRARTQRTLGSSALQINPTLLSERYFGPYWKGLREVILRYCGEQNLIRATVMTVRQNRVWAFSGLDRGPRGWAMIKIPMLSYDPHPTSQSFQLTPEGMQDLGEFNGSVSALPRDQELWFRLISDSRKVKETRTEPELKAIIRRALQLENPRVNNPGTSDCVSCHLAQAVHLWGKANFGAWNWNDEFSKDEFKSASQNLSNTSINPSRTDRVRAFGYFGTEPIFSQRVINETALVVDALKTPSRPHKLR